MIDFYYWPTPNGHKVAIMLEEIGGEYQLHPVNILKGEQFDPDFLEISPNNRIPAIVDTSGPEGTPYALFESGAILLYLAEKKGILWPPSKAARYDMLRTILVDDNRTGDFDPTDGNQENQLRQMLSHMLGYPEFNKQ